MSISLDSSGSANVANSNFGLLLHTCTNTDQDGVLLVGLASDSGGFNTIDNWVVIYNTIPLKRLVTTTITGIFSSATAIYILENPPSGTGIIAVGTGGPLEYFGIFAASFTGVQTEGSYTVESSTGTATPPSVSITTTVDDSVIYDCIDAALENSAFSATSGQTILSQINIGTGFVSRGGHAYEAVGSAGVYSQGYSLASGSSSWSMCAVSLRPSYRMKWIGVDKIIFS